VVSFEIKVGFTRNLLKSNSDFNFLLRKQQIVVLIFLLAIIVQTEIIGKNNMLVL